MTRRGVGLCGVLLLTMLGLAYGGGSLRIILHGQTYSTLRRVVEDLKEHGKLCGGILVSRHDKPTCCRHAVKL